MEQENIEIFLEEMVETRNENVQPPNQVPPEPRRITSQNGLVWKMSEGPNC